MTRSYPFGIADKHTLTRLLDRVEDAALAGALADAMISVAYEIAEPQCVADCEDGCGFYSKLNDELGELEAEIEDLKHDNASLEQEIENLEDKIYTLENGEDDDD